MSYPKLVFRSPGSWPHPPTGATYRLRGVTTEAELAAALAEGWHPTVLEAIQAAGDRAKPVDRRKPVSKKVRKPGRPRGWSLGLAKPVDKPAIVQPVVEAVVADVVEEVDDNSPPTREEMLAQAEKLGIKVDRRWSDARLLAKINAVVDDDRIVEA